MNSLFHKLRSFTFNKQTNRYMQSSVMNWNAKNKIKEMSLTCMILPLMDTRTFGGEFRASLTGFVGAGGGFSIICAFLTISFGTPTSPQGNTLVFVVTITASTFFMMFLRIMDFPSVNLGNLEAS